MRLIIIVTENICNIWICQQALYLSLSRCYTWCELYPDPILSPVGSCLGYDHCFIVDCFLFGAEVVFIYMTRVRYHGYSLPHTCLIFSCIRYVGIILHFLKHPIYCTIYCLSLHFRFFNHSNSDIQNDQPFDWEIASRTRIIF